VEVQDKPEADIVDVVVDIAVVAVVDVVVVDVVVVDNDMEVLRILLPTPSGLVHFAFVLTC
jgi:hypothetical protein